MNILELENIKKYFASQKAVDDISMQIGEGSIFGLLGPNGAGKTTLLRMVTGIFYPDSGNIIFEGKKFNAMEHIRDIGYMPEERGLYKKMKIGEQALYLARLKGMSKAEAMENIKKWFVKFEMESWWNKKVEDLSKGMSQKLQFVTTVLHQPKLIILDEPFSGLDPVNANLIKDEIYNLAKNGSAVIFSTHRMEQVEEICDHIVLVNKGKKILDGTVNNVRQSFKENIYSINASTEVDIESNALFTVVNKQKDKIFIKLNEGVKTNEVLQFLINKDIQVNNFNELLPTLNEIFIKLVQGKAATSFQKEVSLP